MEDHLLVHTMIQQNEAQSGSISKTFQIFQYILSYLRGKSFAIQPK